MFVLLLPAFFIGAIATEECILPTFTEEVDWSRLEGVLLYETFRAVDELEDAFRCKIKYDYEPTENGYRARIGNQTLQNKIPMEYDRVDVGKYQHRVPTITQLQNAVGQTPVEVNLKGHTETACRISGVIASYIDPEARFEFVLACKNRYKKHVTVKTRTPNPTMDDMVDIHNTLAEFGFGDVLLLPKKHCIDINDMAFEKNL